MRRPKRTPQSLEAELGGLREQAGALQAELEELRSRPAEDSSGELQQLAQQREAAEAHAQSLQAELDALREHAAGDDGLADRISGLEETLQSLDGRARRRRRPRGRARRPRSPRCASGSATPARPRPARSPRWPTYADSWPAQERRLAESVGEIAKMNREHRALLQLVERQFQLEDTTTSVPEPRGEARARPLRPGGERLHARSSATGSAPEAGDIVEVDGSAYVVRRHGPSPLPGPRRRCAYLERA